MQPRVDKVERVYFRKEGEYFRAQYAINGVLAHPVECHASVPAEMKWPEEKLLAYLVRCSQTMIQLYGDARENRLDFDLAFADSAAA